MSSFDQLRLELPGGDVFEARGELSITEIQQPFYLLDGFEGLRTIAEELTNTSTGTSQVFIGNSARVRLWRVEFTQWEGSSDSWGSASASDDVLTKLNTLGQALATAAVDGEDPIVFEYGEYSSAGQFGALDVVPGEISLPAELTRDGTPSSFRPTLELREAEDLAQVIHTLAP